MSDSFRQRRVDFTIALGTGTFGETGFNTVALSGLRASVQIQKAGNVAMNTVSARIWGMTQGMMNQLSTLGAPVQWGRRNSVTITAGDDYAGMSQIFFGNIQNGYADYSGLPDVPFVIEGFEGSFDLIKPVPPSSYPGSADVATIMANLANQMGVDFENNGVSVILSSPYHPGTLLDQVRYAADEADINYSLDGNTLAIWPKYGSRGGDIPLISANSGLDGYPNFNGVQIDLRTRFNPSIRYGGKVQIQSDLTPACGEWIVQRLGYDLEANIPDGSWFTDLTVTAPVNVIVATG